VEFDRHLGRIAAKLDRLLEASGRRPVTGPVRSEMNVAAFEEHWQIRLPADYRLFLQRFGDGGPALHALAKGVVFNGAPLEVSLPFPYSEPWLPVGEEFGRSPIITNHTSEQTSWIGLNKTWM